MMRETKSEISVFLNGCLHMQSTRGKRVRPLHKFTSLFRNIISKIIQIELKLTELVTVPSKRNIFSSV